MYLFSFRQQYADFILAFYYITWYNCIWGDKGAKNNFNYKNSTQENSVGTTNIISSAGTKKPVNIAMMPTGNEQYSAMITRSNLFLGDVGFAATPF